MQLFCRLALLPLCQLWLQPSARRGLTCSGSFLHSTKRGKVMSDFLDGKKIIVLAGATSSGKSAASLEIAKLFPDKVEIVIADSVQVYRHLNIASNKPTPEEQEVVPHHLVDIANPIENLSAGDFCALAKEKINDIIDRGKLPVIVGGSTMWIKWLVHGVPDAPVASEHAVRTSAELLQEAYHTKNWPLALSILELYDSNLAKKLSTNDWYRMHRYLEIAIDLKTANNSSSSTASANVENGGLSMSLTNDRKPVLSEYDVRSFFLMEEDRELLFHTIDSRCEVMLANGLLEEVGSLLLEGKLTPDAFVWKSIGYRQTIDYLLNPNTPENDLQAFMLFLSDFAADTRAYARKQHKFYRRDLSMLYLNINRTVEDEQNSKKGQLVEVDKHAPYRQVAEEILHWTCEADRSSFLSTIEKQLEASKYVAKWRKLKNVGPSIEAMENNISNMIEFHAVQSLIDDGEITVSNNAMWNQFCKLFKNRIDNEMSMQMIFGDKVDAEKGEEKELTSSNNRVLKRLNLGQEAVPTDYRWSAFNSKVRADENTQKMKRFVSLIPSPHTPNPRLFPPEVCDSKYRPFVNIADEYRFKLREEKSGLWEKFFSEKVFSENIENGDSLR